ncbi:MAG: MBL fold metallo-hydrolase [Pyrinomonadaceae bacterium]
MKRLLVLLACLFVALSAQISLAQQDWSKVEIKSTKVSGNVYMLQGSGGNIGVSVGADGILIVDDQYAPLADKIKAALKTLGEGKLKFILNTHWHGDHTGGNAAFSSEGSIIAHTNVRKRLAEGMTITGRTVQPASKEALPIITFDHSVSVHFNGEEIRALHLPRGHTDGDAVIFFTNSNVVHMGDLFFNGMFPFVDIDSGGDVEGYMKNIAEVLGKLPAGARIIPGHGPLATADDLKKVHDMMMKTTGIVRDKMKAGKTLDQIKAEGLPEEWKSWSWQFVTTDRWISTIHRSYSKK